jgi:excisionase family DNA binding protein
VTAPDLAALVAQAAPEELPVLIGQLEAAKAAAWARITAPQLAPANGEDRNLSAREAAARLGVSLPYLYKHAHEYPFTVRYGKRVLFSSHGLDAWNRGQRRP